MFVKDKKAQGECQHTCSLEDGVMQFICSIINTTTHLWRKVSSTWVQQDRFHLDRDCKGDRDDELEVQESERKGM